MMEKSKILGGKYEIISEIKKGGFGIVYYGFDRNLGKSIAIKEIAPKLLEEAKYIDMFQEEAKSAAKLSHHNIVHIYDLLKTDDGHFYIIMEYIDGVDLVQINKKSKHHKKKLTLNLATYIIGEICKALEYAHNRKDSVTNEPLNLIHQDITPSNIMISMKGDVKLIDFGIAKVRFEQKSRSRNIVIKGKLPYLSPEQLTGDFFIDSRTDIYSLGIVFFELITGKRLFKNSTDEKTIATIRSAKIDLKLLNELNIPEAIQNILKKSLQKDPDQRYQSANQMYLDLAQFLMESSQTIELSDELGDFVKHLFLLDSTQSIENKTEDKNKEKQQAEQNLQATNDETISLSDINTLAEHFSNQSEPDKNENADTQIETEFLPSIEEEIKNLQISSESYRESGVADSEKFDIKENDFIEIKKDLIGNGKNAPRREMKFEPEIPFDPVDKKPDNKPGKPAGAPPAESAAKASMKPKLADIAKAPKKNETFSPITLPRASDPEDEESEDDIKTVIDVIRLSSRSYKKQIYSGLGAIVLLSFIYFIIDTFLGLSPIGKKIYDTVFPPVIKIVTVPSGAQIFIDEKRLDAKTPGAIQDISPGIHTLKLVYPGFMPIIKSIRVHTKENVKVEGENRESSDKIYLFRFMTNIEISSNPRGAIVYLNGVKINQHTPCIIEWEVGKPLAIELVKEGFERLSGFNFNALDDEKKRTGQRYWSLKKIQAPNGEYIYNLQGMFRKLIRVTSIPSGARIYLDNKPRPVGVTGSGSFIYASFGTHQIELKKNGYLSKIISFEVSEESDSKISTILYRKIKFTAKDMTAPGDNEINARLVSLTKNGKTRNYKEQTPCVLTLSPGSFQALFRKKGYKDAQVQVRGNRRTVVAQMEPNDVYIEITVKDALTGKPIPLATVKFRRLNGDGATEKLFARTDNMGRCAKRLAHGQYIFKTVKKGYFEKRNNYTTVINGRNRLQFTLITQ